MEVNASRTGTWPADQGSSTGTMGGIALVTSLDASTIGTRIAGPVRLRQTGLPAQARQPPEAVSRGRAPGRTADCLPQ
jgi:hypothetical protein